MKVESTIWHLWAMRVLTTGGGQGEQLGLLFDARQHIEAQTSAQLGELGLEWFGESGIRAADGGDPSAALEKAAEVELTPNEIYALHIVYYGDGFSPGYVWGQTLPALAKRAARTLGPVLRELTTEAQGWEAFEKLPDIVKGQMTRTEVPNGS